MRTRLATTSIFLLVAFTAACSAVRDEGGDIESAGALDAFQMQVGDCFDDSFFGGDEVSDVPGVPCATPHDNEVYALFDIPGNTFPGADAVQEIADDGCLERFQSAIGVSYEESVLVYTTMNPTAGSWEERGDQEVVCIAYHMELEKLEGTVLGSGL